MRHIGLVLAVALVGCGGSGGGPGDLVGEWALTDSHGCALGYMFMPPTYEVDQICTLNSGAIAMETHVGTYVATDSDVTLTLMASTCDGESARSDRYGWDVSGGKSLRIVAADGILVFDKLPAERSSGTGGVAVEFGCFDKDGYFTKRDVLPVGGK